jgi:hypothetical protein
VNDGTLLTFASVLLLILLNSIHITGRNCSVNLTYFETKNSFKKGNYVELCMIFPLLSGLIVLCVKSTAHYKILAFSAPSVSLSRLESF